MPGTFSQRTSPKREKAYINYNKGGEGTDSAEIPGKTQVMDTILQSSNVDYDSPVNDYSCSSSYSWDKWANGRAAAIVCIKKRDLYEDAITEVDGFGITVQGYFYWKDPSVN